MHEVRPNFSDEQWEFLAILHMMRGPVSINVLGSLAPLSPGPLFELLQKGKELEWIIQEGDDHFTMGTNLTLGAEHNIREINTPEHLSELTKKLSQLNLEHLVPQVAMAHMLREAGKSQEAGDIFQKMALDAWEKDDYQDARNHVEEAATCLAHCITKNLNRDSLNSYVSSVLRLDQLSLILGQGLPKMPKHLFRALKASEKMGDQRSHALINLHLGRLHFFLGHRDKAFDILSVAMDEVEALGDDDILQSAAGFLGIYYTIKGEHEKALEHLERAERYAMEKQSFYDPITPVFLGACLVYLGDFHRAIGCLDSHWRLAKERQDHALCATLEGILGIALLLINKEPQASQHLESAIKLAQEHKAVLGLRSTRGGIALKYLLSGDAEAAYKELGEAFLDAQSSKFRFYFAAWIPEIIFEAERLGIDPLPHLNFDQELEEIMSGPSAHLKGTVLRLRARRKIDKDYDKDSISRDLERSRKHLENSGDRVQLSKTLIETARFALTNNQREEAHQLVCEAWKTLGGYAENFFPDDLRPILEPGEQHSTDTAPQSNLQNYIELMESIAPFDRQGEIYSRMIVATNRYFGAERGGLFWFPNGEFTTKPELRAGCNLSNNYVQGSHFKSQMQLVIRAFKEKKPIIERFSDTDRSDQEKHTRAAVLCLPLEIRGKSQAVLYHDNSFLEDCFDFLDQQTIKKLMQHFSNYVEQIWDGYQQSENREKLNTRVTIAEAAGNTEGLVYCSAEMKKLITMLDRVAASDSTALLLGETGVGKEVMARRLHTQSARHEKPFIVVDATTIPETLMESELFGHEKGAFTGADRQKKGRVELADGGTLFIDEVGELPLSVQSKLLRAIQERQFQRLGGNSVLKSDFRLIAATNRDMALEVEEGRFRADLYYRLNVVPITIPPLRERPDDIILLAQHFLDQFSQRYKQEQFNIDASSKAILKNYAWPGNVRELENVMERAALLSSEGQLEIDLPTFTMPEATNPFADSPSLEEVQRRYISYVLSKTGGKVSGPKGAAEWLGLPRSTLLARMKKLGVNQQVS